MAEDRWLLSARRRRLQQICTRTQGSGWPGGFNSNVSSRRRCELFLAVCFRTQAGECSSKFLCHGRKIVAAHIIPVHWIEQLGYQYGIGGIGEAPAQQG